MQKPKNNKKFALIWHYLKSNVHFFIIAATTAMLKTATNAIVPQIMLITVDSVVGREPFSLPQSVVNFFALDTINVTQGVIIASVLILIVTVIACLFDYVSRMSTAKCSEGFIKSMRDELYSHIQRLPFSWHTDNSTGDIIQRCTSDVTVILNFVTGQLLTVIGTFFLLIIYFVIMFSISIPMSITAFAFLPVMVMYSVFFYSRIGKRFLAADEAEGELMTQVQENLTGVRVVKAFGREKHETEQFDSKNDKWADHWIHLGRLTSVYWATGDLITGFQVLSVLVMGVYQSVGGNISVGQLIAFMSYNAVMLWPVRGLGRVLSEMSKAGVSIDRVQYILNAKEEKSASDATRPDMTGDIEFNNVTFRYKDDLLPVLKNVSFKVPKGKTFAILGGTGSGKSTMMHLLDKLYSLPKDSGSIKISGVDIDKIELSWLRTNVGIVLQEPFLFSMTIEENIKATNKNASTDEVRKVAKIACVDDDIINMAKGYETVVGEKGVTLSGGQKQRVAIARMLLQKAPIKIFDDSLSAVDAETDAKIRDELAKNEDNSTVILISHRITTLMKADCILVLENGEVAQQGTHEELVNKDGIYKRIYDIQMRSEDRDFLQESAGDN